MSKINKKQLETLYKVSEIQEVWQASQNLNVIEHPQFGLISPRKYRGMYHKKPCLYCGKKMVHGEIFKTLSKEEAITLGYQYLNTLGRKKINKAGKFFFHPHYVSLDHILNKARFPEKMFDYDNLQVICWKCNNLKGDNNDFDLEHTLAYLDSLVDETLKHYRPL